MSSIVDVIEWGLLLVGSIFAVIGGIGLLRFPDFYTRVHAVGVTDTMGAGCILLACCFEAGLTLITIKLVTIWAFIYLTGPAGTHALAKAAYAKGLKVEGDQEDRRSAVSL